LGRFDLKKKKKLGCLRDRGDTKQNPAQTQKLAMSGDIGKKGREGEKKVTWNEVNTKTKQSSMRGWGDGLANQF